MSGVKQVRILAVRPSIAASSVSTACSSAPAKSTTAGLICTAHCGVRVITAKSTGTVEPVSTASSFAVEKSNDISEHDSVHVCIQSPAPERPTVQQMYYRINFVNEVRWISNLFNWFAGDYERTHRYAAYVFGSGGEGKTRVARALVEGKNVFECRLTEAYAFDGFESDTDILLVEDVNWDCFDNGLRSTLLSIMARQPAVIQRKYKPQTTVVNDKVLTIFTSNFKLPVDVAFRRRSYLVWANAKACKDAASEGDDDPGDSDAQYVNPKLPAGAVVNRRYHWVHTLERSCSRWAAL